MNPTVLITGAAGGIGRATVKYFAQQGWRVLAVDRAADFGEPFFLVSNSGIARFDG